MEKIAIVTGGNRGMGFEVSRQLARLGMRVILTSRDPYQSHLVNFKRAVKHRLYRTKPRPKGRQAAEELRREGLDVIYHPLDVTVPETVVSLSRFVEKKFGQVDVLINNAGLLIDGPDLSVFAARVDTIRRTMDTNVYGPLLLMQSLVPLMKVHKYGRIVNVSSDLGQLSTMGGGHTAYRLSKASLNALTRIFANELKDTGILVNSMHPGWVRTEMGGPNAPRTPEEGVDTMVWLATLPDDGPTGGLFFDREQVPW